MASVFIGNATLVGYTNLSRFKREGVQLDNLPKLKPSILSPIEGLNLNIETIKRLNFLYAKDYEIWQDVAIIWKKLRYLSMKIFS